MKHRVFAWWSALALATVVSSTSAQTAPSQPGLPYVVAVPAPGGAVNPESAEQRSASDDESERPQWPGTLPYVEGASAPPGYTLQESRLKGLVVGGIIPLSIFYLASFGVAEDNDFKGAAGWLACAHPVKSQKTGRAGRIQLRAIYFMLRYGNN